MAKRKQTPDQLGEIEQAMALQRARIMRPLSLVGVIFFLPVAINNVVQGRLLLASVMLLVISMLAINAVAMYRNKPLPIGHGWLVLPAVAGVALSISTQGIYGVLWSYPIMMYGYFVMPRRLAQFASLAFWALNVVLIYSVGDTSLTIRVALSLLMTIVVINVIIDVISDLQEKLIAQTITDPLTGAFNRRHMQTQLTNTMERCRRTGAPCSMLIMDIDHFKETNDQLGHLVGDQRLIDFVKLVKFRARKGDMLFRTGGEEFLQLLPDTRLADALVVAEGMRVSVAELVPGTENAMSVSIGVAEFLPSEGLDSWLRRADNAMYRAKADGRNRVMS